MPNWNAPSEVWAQRMIEILQDHIGLIAAYDAEDSWNNKIPAFRLGPPTEPKRIWLRAIDKVRNRSFGKKNITSALLTQCRLIGIDKVLFNYATMPLAMMEFTEKCNAEIFIHCHGYDVALEGRIDTWPHDRLHVESYTTDLLKLSKRATFISNSRFTTSNLISIGIPPARIQQKYFGVKSYEKFIPHNGIRRPVILQLGRLVDLKGPDMTIRAFEKARSEGLDAELIVAGDGPLMVTCELLQLRSPYSDDIKILGPVNRDEAAELIAKADIFTVHLNKGVLTNREEAFGVVFIEAMAAGLPIVAGNSGAITETVIDGKTGILFEPEDVSGQAAALFKLGTDLDMRNRMGKEAWLLAKERFSMDQEKTKLRRILNLR